MVYSRYQNVSLPIARPISQPLTVIKIKDLVSPEEMIKLSENWNHQDSNPNTGGPAGAFLVIISSKDSS
jgi:hypothetical protein